MTQHLLSVLRRSASLALVGAFGLMLAACASEPAPPEPVVQEPVPQRPKPEPPKPTYSIELAYPDGPVTFTSLCDYSPYVDKLRSVHSGDRNVHAVLEYAEDQAVDCSDRVTVLEDYLRNLGALK